ncbi:hypothetical protein D3C87_1618650 [compost metagenome]
MPGNGVGDGRYARQLRHRLTAGHAQEANSTAVFIGQDLGYVGRIKVGGASHGVEQGRRTAAIADKGCVDAGALEKHQHGHMRHRTFTAMRNGQCAGIGAAVFD